MSRETRMPPPKISIIATNFNCGHALDKHLRSIYSQFGTDEFEYVAVDNFSRDSSPAILRSWSTEHSNFHWSQRHCSMGRGREIAASQSQGQTFLVVDTDTVYYPILRPFVTRAVSECPRDAVQAIYAGTFPRALWREVGGRHDFNSGEDLEMWMRLLQVGHMKWYPVRMGDNIKEAWARDSEDFKSSRYSRYGRLSRLMRSEFDQLRLARYDAMDLRAIWKSNTIDFGLGKMEQIWFGERPRLSLPDRIGVFMRRVWHLIQP